MERRNVVTNSGIATNGVRDLAKKGNPSFVSSSSTPSEFASVSPLSPGARSDWPDQRMNRNRLEVRS